MRFDPGWRPRTADVALAAVIAALQEAGALSVPGTGPLDHLAVLAGSLALVARRRAPVAVLAAVTACMLVYAVGSDPGPPAAFPVLIAVHTAARAGHRLPAAAAGAAFLGGTLASALVVVSDPAAAGGRSAQDTVRGTILLLGWFLAAGVSGTVSRHRQAYLEQAEQRAAEAERTREEAALRRAGEERLRIARELHDSLTHSISIIKVQAGVAVHLARKRGEEVPEALLAIQEASGEAMRELRATLEVLRDPAGDPAGDARGSGLGRLDDLVDRARAAGLTATVAVTGERRTLPAAVDHSAYRIVQEALTNVSRHSASASASVRIGYHLDRLVVQVDDDGRASPGTSPAPGNGLTGMRERVTALGGRLHAGPRPQGGFTVRAELPLEETGLPPEETGRAERAGLSAEGAS
ncbi:sensor histidine kinase [Planomonospora sp. ID67723]|uniref:sensor histidine kinase n=1 Tax=Planomonospora sp. ID67723 TaxID=2738134 RepID=UPI0018C39115|nr:sensor histidine kinase [Planomonospora sp. ID67723]MBG0826682.1 sensor histidine kinase [Planomonospora sp. ID67723]